MTLRRRILLMPVILTLLPVAFLLAFATLGFCGRPLAWCIEKVSR
jgi:hypothetical protein